MLWNNSRSISISTRHVVSLIAVTLIIIGMVNTTEAFPRKPLFEDFTSTTCPPCAAWAGAQERGLEMLGDAVSVVAYHMNWPQPGNDPWCADNQVDNLNPGRRQYYSVNGVPTILIDGVTTQVWQTNDANRFANELRARANVPSPLQISLNGRIVGGTLTIHVEIEASQAVNNVRLYLSLNEIYYRYDAYAEWWDHYDPMVKMIPNYNGTQISVTPDQPYSHDFEQSMAGLGWHELEIENLKLVAWVQEANHNVLQSQNFQLGIDSPSIEILDWTITDDQEGDGDTRPEPGETAHFTFNMQNAANYLPAETVDVTLSTEDAGIDITDAQFHLDGLENGASGDNNGSPFRITIADDFVAHPVTFTLSLVATPGDFMIEQDVTMMIDWPPFLLVDAANNQNAGDHLRNAFGRNPMPWYDVWDRNEDGPMVDDILLSQYKVVLWHTFNNSNDAIIDMEAEYLTDYLDNGGTLVMSSAYLPGQLGNHRLLTQYLGVQVDQENLAGVNYVRGVQGDRNFDGVSMFLGGSMGFPTARMSFRANENGVAVMNYTNNNGQEIRGIAAIKHEAGTYRTLLLGFPLETITGASRTDSLIAFTNHIWDWVQHAPVSAPNDEVIPARFALDPAFPNPFNAQTVINYSVAKNSAATLKLFDIAGREIATLFDGEATVGSHSTILNAQEMGLESGIYYVRFEAAGDKAVSQIVYLK